MDIQILTPQLDQVDKSAGDAYLKFQLDRDTPAILSLEHTQEVLIVPIERITPIPNMPTCVLGLLNRRNKVLWVVDLVQMLNLQHLDTNIQQYHMAIIKVGKIPMGLVVQEVKGVMRFSSDLIQSSTGFVSPDLNHYIHGCIMQQKDMLLVLNAEAIVHSPIFLG